MASSSPYEHGGNIHAAANLQSVSPDAIIDFSANINPLGPPEWIRSCISRELDSIVHYPDPTASSLQKQIALEYNLSLQSILVANGSTELLYQLPRVLECRRAVIPVPCYIDYLKVMEMAGVKVKTVYLEEKTDFMVDCEQLNGVLQSGDLLLLGNPNNPTGKCVDRAPLQQLIRNHPSVTFLLDEAFLEFVEGHKTLSGTEENIITLHSLTKFYAIPGLRLGFGVFPESLATRLKEIQPPWPVNTLAQKVGERALADKNYQRRTRAACFANSASLKKDLSVFKDLKIFDSSANYFLVKLEGKYSVADLQRQLGKKNILIRNCANYLGLSNDFFRIAVRSREDNQLLCDTLSTFLPKADSFKNKKRKRRKTPSLMFQGTTSNAGKSILTAALCRILLQDGVHVAPFKAQNMSLNSHVTMDGLEMGRAQVVQAQAARLDPDVLMNPILLKPNSDTGSQVIVRGRALGNMSVMDYVKYKEQAMTIVADCYDELASQYQAVILEGAGSPGEVNLKKHDIVNMRMARHAGAPVVLVGDIDRGGVYASFVGHMEVLSQWERKLVAGFLVNRFRGRKRLLDDAHRYVKEHTGKDVLGVIPYLVNHGIPEEDSVSFKDGLFEGEKPVQEHVEIAVISLPHISNFTDLEPFLNEADVYLRIVDSPDTLGTPDAVLLPGSKNVIGDLLCMQSTGMADAIRKYAESGGELVGICGGYQMLGDSIKDPHGIESNRESMAALALLRMETVLASNKTLTRKKGVHIPSGQAVTGYEIHHGLTKTDGKPLFRYDDNSSCGTVSGNQKIWGGYLHGLFDSDVFRRWFIDRLRRRKGYNSFNGPLFSYNLEPAFDKLAESVRQGMDMDRVYQLLGL